MSLSFFSLYEAWGQLPQDETALKMITGKSEFIEEMTRFVIFSEKAHFFKKELLKLIETFLR
jgi:hypothetical protein